MTHTGKTTRPPLNTDSKLTRRLSTFVSIQWGNWQTHYQRLIEPSASIQHDEHRRQARLLASLLIVLLIAGIIALPIWTLLNPDISEVLYITVGFVSGLAAAYFFSRTIYYRVGSYFIIALFPTIVVAVVTILPLSLTEQMAALNFLIFTTLLASILLSIRETFFITIIILLGIATFFFVSDARLAMIFPYLVFVGMMSALFMLIVLIRRNYLHAIHQSELRYRSLFEQLNDAVFILDMNDNHLEVNQRAVDLLAYTSEEFVDLSFQELVAPSDRTDSEQILSRLLLNEHIPPHERWLCKSDGTEIPVEVNVDWIRDDDGNPIYLQRVVRDITERKKIQEQKLVLALEQERVQLLAQFVQNVSHELRTPLAIISSALYLMSKVTDTEKQHKYQMQIEQSVERENHLLDMILLMTELDSNLSFDYKNTNINDLIDHIISSKSHHLGENHPTISFNPESLLPLVWADEHWLTEAFNQFLDNAIKFTDVNGTISFRTYQHEQQIVVEVNDNGIGIDEPSLSHIFERFWRLDEAHSTSGFGLGLPIAQKIIEQHGGTIEVASSPDQGSTFKIILPITNRNSSSRTSGAFD